MAHTAQPDAATSGRGLSVALNDSHAGAVVKRASRRQEAEEHGSSAWKVAFADFCLALLCLFLVLWLLAVREQDDLKARLAQSNPSHFDESGDKMMPTYPDGRMIERHPEATGGGDARGRRGAAHDEIASAMPRGRLETRRDLEALAVLLDRLGAESGLASNVQAVVTPYGVRVMLHDTDGLGMFERGNAVPSTRFRGLLRKMGPLFARIENQMLIVGHTDATPYAGDTKGAFSNWDLSNQRAVAARAQLIDGGMRQESVLQVVGMADRAPLDVADGRAPVNRRIELLILTTGQAQAVAAMFGAPQSAQAALTSGVDTVLPGPDALRELRGQLGAKPPPAPVPR